MQLKTMHCSFNERTSMSLDWLKTNLTLVSFAKSVPKVKWICISYPRKMNSPILRTMSRTPLKIMSFVRFFENLIASIEKFRHGSSNPGKFFLLADYAHGFLWADAGYQQYYRRAADELAGHEKKRGINPAAIADRALKTCLLGNPQAAAGNWRGLYRLQVPEELPVSSESDGTYADAMGLTRSSYDDLSTGDADDIAQTIAFSRVVADRRGRRHADPEDDAVRL